MRTGVFLAALASLLAFGADKSGIVPTSGAENDKLEIQARLILDKDEITKVLGTELPPGIVAVEITAMPRGDEAVPFGRDDFTLVSHKDGQRSGPYSPSQIAGGDILVVRQTVESGGGMGQQRTGPVWGGIPGTMGRPQQMPGGTGIGNTASQTGAEAGEVTSDGNKGKPNPLLDALRAKTLQDTKELKDTAKGYLFFPLEGKKLPKPKDLELLYRGPGGRLDMPFK